MSIVFFGTPVFAVPSLRALIASGERIDAVVTKKDKPKGRGRVISSSPVKETAIASGLRVLEPVSMKDEEFVSEISALRPEFIVVVAYGKILPKAILDIPSIAPVNVHASLLPRWRGASPVAWSVLSGDKETGITTMLIAEPLDEGDIILMEKTEIKEEDTTESLSLRLSEMGAAALLKTLKGLREGSLKPVPQSGEPTYARPLKKEDGLIDWRRTAHELFDFVRGMYPWPCAYCFIRGERVKILSVKPLEGSGAPGRIENISSETFSVGASSGLLSIIMLQPEGKKPMTAGAFLKGRRGRHTDGLGEGAFLEAL
jgi:methionyl-tRNA formyltransferase